MDGSSLDQTTWTALALTLTVLGGALSWVAYRRRGLAAGLKGVALSLLPLAALLTGTLRLLVAVCGEVSSWATRLVLSPVVWSGVALAGVAVVLWVLAGMLAARGIGVSGKAAEKAVRKGERARRQVGAAPAAEAPAPARPAAGGAKQGPRDDDMDEIEAILKKHGI
ncbi:hypothetical protein [Nocardioides marmoraquaticus]